MLIFVYSSVIQNIRVTNEMDIYIFLLFFKKLRTSFRSVYFSLFCFTRLNFYFNGFHNEIFRVGVNKNTFHISYCFQSVIRTSMFRKVTHLTYKSLFLYLYPQKRSETNLSIDFFFYTVSETLFMDHLSMMSRHWKVICGINTKEFATGFNLT